MIIGKRQGYFTGMLKELKINIVIVNENIGVGEKETKIFKRIIKYKGDEIRISIK